MENAIKEESGGIHPATCYGFSIPHKESSQSEIEARVAQGKVVGEWTDKLKVYADPTKSKERLEIFAAEGLELSAEMTIPMVNNLWQCLEIFSGGSLDTLILGNKILELSDEQRDLLEDLTQWADKINASIEKQDLSSLEIPDYEEKLKGDPFLLNQYGKILVLAQDYSRAGRIFRHAIEAEYNFSEAYSNLGALMWQLGSQKDAFELFTEALMKNPNHSVSQLNFFDAAYELEAYDVVIKMVDANMDHLINKVELLLHKAICLHKLDQTPESVSILEDILLESPEDEEAKSLLEKFRAELS